MGAAVDVPSLLMVLFDSLYPGNRDWLKGQGAETASPRALYFSTPLKGGLKADRLPYESADPIQNTPWMLAGKVIRSLAPTLDAEAKMIIPALRASLSADVILRLFSLRPQDIEMMFTRHLIAHRIA